MIAPRFIMEVEFDHPNLDWDILFDDNLVDLAKRFKEAKDTGFDTSLGACPNLKIKKITDETYSLDIPINEFNLILEEL